MDILQTITQEFNLQPTHAKNILSLIDEGNTIPFIARYRKEMTGACDDQVLRALFDRLTYLRNLEKRKEEVANAVTEQGELYFVDGNANRIGAVCFGPRTVVLVVGKNKIVPDLEAAYRRVKTVAAPRNTARLGCKTPCAENGVCCAVDSKDPTAGCDSAGRICCSYLTLGYQRVANRVKVILVDEPLGF